MKTSTVLFLLLNFSTCLALKCYSCQYSEGHDDKCLRSPDASVTCGDNDVCLIKNVKKQADGVVFSFLRGCILKSDPQAINACVGDSNFETCFSICEEDLCNGENQVLSSTTLKPTEGDPGNGSDSKFNFNALLCSMLILALFAKLL